MATFGETTPLTGAMGLNNHQIATIGIVADGNGLADSITVYVKFTGVGELKFKAALFEYIAANDAGALIATTPETIIAGDSESKWCTANFSAPKPPVVDGTTYWVAVLTKASAGTVSILGKPTNGTLSLHNNRTYTSGWLDPWINEANFWLTSIYCTYTPVSAVLPVTGKGLITHTP